MRRDGWPAPVAVARAAACGSGFTAACACSYHCANCVIGLLSTRSSLRGGLSGTRGIVPYDVGRIRRPAAAYGSRLMHPTITVTLVDGARVVVPDTLDLITPYVLQEQLDWFEDEIKFLRRLLRPGQHVIDIGANYGVYALSMARAVGPTGRVWAFEPASSTAGLLAQSIATNDFGHVVLEQCAL